MQDNTINVQGSVSGIAAIGDNSVINNQNQTSLTDRDIAEKIEEILTSLHQKYPKATPLQKQTVFQMELQEQVLENPTLKVRLLSAVKAGSCELVKVLTNNLFVAISLESIKGWLEADPS